MKKFFSILSILSLILFNFSWLFAAEWTTVSQVDHFEISTTPESTKPWEAIDLTVKAVDKSWNVKKDYVWTIYITVENDTKATVPYIDWYEFVPADLWQKTFSKWLSFTKTGKMKVTVIDIDNDQLEWSIDVNVWEWEATPTWAGSGDITITSPDNWVTISWNKITVTWTAKKNSKVQYFLNWKELKDLEWQTDEKWAFSAEITEVTQSQNVIQVRILDGNDAVIAESSKISVSVDAWGPAFKSLTIKEWQEAPAWSEINISANADSGLNEFMVTIWEITQPLTESTSSPWVYEGKITLPTSPADYSLDISIKNAMWKETTKKWVASIKAIESNIFKNIKSQVSDKKVTFTFEVNPDKEEYAKFKFKYWTSADTLKTAWDTQIKESTTFEKIKIMSGSTYSWYIPGLDPASTYYFQIYAIDKDGREISWIQSEIIEVAFSMSSAGNKCMISNVSWLKTTKNGDVVELSWDSITEATSYNVYKKDKDWNFVLIENVKANKYTINISWDKVKYDEFTIKAVCGDGDNVQESADYSQATKVQTWPAQIALLLWISLTVWYLFIRRRLAK